MSDYLKKIVTLTKNQYDTLVSGGTVGSQTGLNPDYFYYVTDEVSKEDFVITFSGTTEGGDAACDKTWHQINLAVNSGKRILARYGQISDNYAGYTDLIVSYTYNHGSLIGLGGTYFYATFDGGLIDSMTRIYCDITSNYLIVKVEEM